MVKEAKNIDFYTSGRQLSEQDFARISEWIKKQKQAASRPKKYLQEKSTPHTILPQTGLKNKG